MTNSGSVERSVLTSFSFAAFTNFSIFGFSKFNAKNSSLAMNIPGWDVFCGLFPISNSSNNFSPGHASLATTGWGGF